MIKIRFLGGARTVTGSSHMVSTDDTSVLLDAGLFYGPRREFYEVNQVLNYNPRKVNALILSHAHIDHCGNIPNVMKNGLRCKIYATSATKDLARLMLEDSGKIQEEDTHYLNKINKRIGTPMILPLYTKKEASKAVKKFHPLSYGRAYCVARNIYATLYDAGHILGSSVIVLDIDDGKKALRVGYAVDLGRKNLPFLNDPVAPLGLDYLVLESTYGGRAHAPIEEAKAKLKDVLNRTLSRQGKVIIPSFALERTQEVLYFLGQLLKEKAIPVVPIYVDSPLATNITGVFKNHVDDFNERVRKGFEQGNDPFEFLNLRYTRSQEESKALNNDKRPMIIIAGSGMCESGRVLHHLKNNIEDSRNTVLVVGYMAKNTLGRKIVEKNRYVRIYGAEYELNCEVVVINSFSAHADRNGLIEYARACLPLKRVFLVHGDEEQSQALRDTLLQSGINAYIPDKNEEIGLV